MKAKWFILWLIVTSAGLAACVSSQRHSNAYALYTVRYGDTLYSVAWRYRLDFKKLAAWNGVNKPYVIHPGQKLKLNPPATPARLVERSPKPKEKRVISSPGGASKKVAINTNSISIRKKGVPVPDSAQHYNPMDWYWPVKGKVVKTYSAQARGKKGIEIAGRRGQPVKAASAGRVVYSGSGLIGYGQLIIIKHNKKYLSAYAHNRKLLVREGERVKIGQQIAELGSSGADRPKLHFEIRKNGEPVDPLRYLPTQ